jgi:hypothetical protein
LKVAHEVLSHYWSSYDGNMPPEMPKCGFDNGRCDYTTFYLTIGVLIFFAGPFKFYLFLALIIHGMGAF